MDARSSRITPAILLLLVGAGAFITALDQTVVVTALPTIMVDLNVTITDLDRASWIITSYLLGYTIAMPLVGRMADVYGCARVYKIALMIFILGSVLVAVSSSLEWMVAARFIQAAGGGATVPVGMAITALLLPSKLRGLSLGIIAGAAEAGSMLGPIYGAAILEMANWRWIFWLNVPQALILLATFVILPNSKTYEGHVDYIGALLMLLMLASATIGLSQKSLFNGFSAVGLVLLSCGLLFCFALLIQQKKSAAPLFPRHLFTSVTFISINIAQLLVGGALIVAMVTVPLMANTVMGKDATTGALWLLKMTLLIPVGAVLGGLVLFWINAKWITIGGLAVAAFGLYLMSGWQLTLNEVTLTLHLAITGFGFGLVISPILTTALSVVGDNYWATAAALVVVARMLGMTLGLAALAAWGVGHFEVLTSAIQFPILEIGQPAQEFEEQLWHYNNQVLLSGLSIFHNFLRFAAVTLLIAILPSLMVSDRRRV